MVCVGSGVVSEVTAAALLRAREPHDAVQNITHARIRVNNTPAESNMITVRHRICLTLACTRTECYRAVDPNVAENCDSFPGAERRERLAER